VVESISVLDEAAGDSGLIAWRVASIVPRDEILAKQQGIQDLAQAQATNETAAPIANETAAPIANETAPIATETAAPIANETAALIATETAAPIANETAAPMSTITAAPIATETAAPIATETVVTPAATEAAAAPAGTEAISVAPIAPIAQVPVAETTTTTQQGTTRRRRLQNFLAPADQTQPATGQATTTDQNAVTEQAPVTEQTGVTTEQAPATEQTPATTEQAPATEQAAVTTEQAPAEITGGVEGAGQIYEIKFDLPLSPIFKVKRSTIDSLRLPAEQIFSKIVTYRSNIHQQMQERISLMSFIVSLELLDKVQQYPLPLSNVTELVEVHLPKLSRNTDSSQKECVVWIPLPIGESTGFWSADSCSLIEENDEYFICGCSETTQVTVIQSQRSPEGQAQAAENVTQVPVQGAENVTEVPLEAGEFATTQVPVQGTENVSQVPIKGVQAQPQIVESVVPVQGGESAQVVAPQQSVRNVFGALQPQQQQP
jgi:hypothetical protein